MSVAHIARRVNDATALAWPGKASLLALFCAVVLATPTTAPAQQSSTSAPAAPAIDQEEAERLANEQLAQPTESADAAAPPPGATTTEQIDWLDLILYQGGFFMYPIGIISIIVIAFGVERAIGLRRGKVIPNKLVTELGELAGRPGGLDPRKAYQACQRHPSAAAYVIRSALLKVGRPHSEVEQAVLLASEREASRLYSNVRPILLGISVAPLLGLLGTVQGMIMAFFTNTHLGAGVNRAQALSEGIYTALVTTLAGLSVAIPAALLAHYYEGRIQTFFREIDELLLNMLPELERYEGKLRVKRVERGHGGDEGHSRSRSATQEPGESGIIVRGGNSHPTGDAVTEPAKPNPQVSK